jgi:predicted transcriptional regulator
MAMSVLTALGDAFSERIVACAVDRARTVEEISEMEGIPLSTCYRRIRALHELGLIVVERIIVTGTGNRYAVYRSSFKSYLVSIDARGLEVEAELNEEVADKYRSRQFAIAHSGMP